MHEEYIARLCSAAGGPENMTTIINFFGGSGSRYGKRGTSKRIRLDVVARNIKHLLLVFVTACCWAASISCPGQDWLNQLKYPQK